MEASERGFFLLQYLAPDMRLVSPPVRGEIVTRLERFPLEADFKRCLTDYGRRQDDLLQRKSFYKLLLYRGKTVWMAWDITP